MLVVVRGAGDIASGIAVRLHRSGASIVMLDVAVPTSVRRTVCFSEAVRLGEAEVEGIRAVRCESASEAAKVAATGTIAVLVDPKGESIPKLAPEAVIDAILAKENLGTTKDMAPVVIGVGPGFHAGESSNADCHAAIETKRGHYLGRVIYDGSPIPNTGVPGKHWWLHHRTRAARAGRRPLRAHRKDWRPGQEGRPRGQGLWRAPLRNHRRRASRPSPGGLPRHQGHEVRRHRPALQVGHCFSVSDKARAVGGGVLEALLHFSHRLEG